MPWKEVKPMEEKVLFLADYLRKGHNFKDLCSNYGISRKTGYKWVLRYFEEGVDALHDRSRKPKNHPQQTPYAIQKEIIDLRKKRKIKLGPGRYRVFSWRNTLKRTFHLQRPYTTYFAKKDW